MGKICVCKQCGKEFERSRRNRIYCSIECGYLAELEKNRRRYAVKKTKLAPRICIVCGKTYQPHNSQQKACSIECGLEKNRRKRKAYADSLKGKNKICKRCGVDFVGSKDARYCPDCRCAIRTGKAKDNSKSKDAVKKIGLSDELMQGLHADGLSYAEYQQQKTLAMVPRIDVMEVIRNASVREVQKKAD